MSTLPKLNIKFNNSMKGLPDDGLMVYKYSPFYNLKVNKSEFESSQSGENIDLSELRLTTKEAGLSIESPIELDIEESYDGSANIVLNDKKNPLKIVNSRFYLTGAMEYKIGDRKGNIDTNIYTKENFLVESKITKSVQSLVKVDFSGLLDSGQLPIGNYNFYFKLADADGNESDFIAESGNIVCHIGSINQPYHIRGGQLNENSNKSIKLQLSNLDMAYSYINIYYVRTTEHEGQQLKLAYKIKDKYKINGITSDIIINGYEQLEELEMSDIQTEYAEFNSVNSAENCRNVLFAGNITNEYELYKQLEKLSLFVAPTISFDRSIGNLNSQYQEEFNKEWGYEYYNAKNVYYSLGYWNDEIYRFGIMYILNDYTLSPVFNVRGIKELRKGYNWGYNDVKPSTRINIQDDYSIEGTQGMHNSKGVVKLSLDGNNDIFTNKGDVKPLGLKFNFLGDIVDGLGGLKDLTKGFIIVRQKRIPTILAQSIGISTTKNGNIPVIKSDNGYITDGFLHADAKGNPRLGKSTIVTNKVHNNALLCPEASMRASIYNAYFNSSEYTLKESIHQPNSTSLEQRKFNRSKYNKEQYELPIMRNNRMSTQDITTSLMLIEPGIETIRNGNGLFSSKAGDSVLVHNVVDIDKGDHADPSNKIVNINGYNNSITKVRGEYNSYIGVGQSNIKQGTYYNIYQKNYDFNKNWKEYFKSRYHDSSPYYPISDRTGWNDKNITLYRGDCYINTYTHRMNWNFIDPEHPGNTKIVDPYTWFKNYKIKNNASKSVSVDGIETDLEYNQLLPIFTFKLNGQSITSRLYDEQYNNDFTKVGIIAGDDKKFKTYAAANGEFGYTKINSLDMNAVGLGQWVTFKVFSNTNLAFRDVDLSRPDEEASFKMKRSFYPLQKIEPKINLPESTVLNRAFSKNIGDRMYLNVTDKPFYKTNFSTRIYYSNTLQKTSFVNGNRIFYTTNYEDYTVEYGKIIKLVEWYGSIIAIMEHGILMIPVNEQVMLPGQDGQQVTVNTGDVLSKNPRVLSNSFGSIWADSVVKTDKFIYGIDTVAKKIWRTNGQGVETISDMSIQQYLNDHIKLHEADKDEKVYLKSIKTHYNAFKSDIMFVFNYNNVRWNMCWNENLEKWITRYTWFPEFSENINNIFYTFGNKYAHDNAENNLYKHGFAGVNDIEGDIKPAHWYDEQHPFEFEFVVNDVQGIQKIFDNIKIISNKVEPNSIIYEITGDGFEWADQKEDIYNINKSLIDLEKESKGFNYIFNFPFRKYTPKEEGGDNNTYLFNFLLK